MKPLLTAVAGLALAAGTARAQMPSLRLEVHGGAGYTVVDKNKWSGYSDARLNDWNYVEYQGYAQLFARLPMVDVGVEAGYQYFWWYTYVTTTGYYVTNEVEATHAHAVVRVRMGPLATAELGAGAFFFDGFTDLGGHAAVGLAIPVGPRVSIPLQVRADAIFDSNGGTMLPVGLTAGLAIKL